jgi:hypothetical protein
MALQAIVSSRSRSMTAAAVTCPAS